MSTHVSSLTKHQWREHKTTLIPAETRHSGCKLVFFFCIEKPEIGWPRYLGGLSSPYVTMLQKCFPLRKFTSLIECKPQLWRNTTPDVTTFSLPVCLPTHQAPNTSGSRWWSRWSRRAPGSAPPPGTTAGRTRTPACPPTPGTTSEDSTEVTWHRESHDPKSVSLFKLKLTRTLLVLIVLNHYYTLSTYT